MSGLKIDDKGGWPSTGDGMMKSKNRLRTFTEKEGAGYVGKAYPDTIEQVDSALEKGVKKVKSHPMKDGYRN